MIALAASAFPLAGNQNPQLGSLLPKFFSLLMPANCLRFGAKGIFEQLCLDFCTMYSRTLDFYTCDIPVGPNK